MSDDRYMNAGRWRILDKKDGKPIEGEVYYGPKSAQRACMILAAHEVKNGRVAAYVVDPTITIPWSLEELNLPEWALEALLKGDVDANHARPVQQPQHPDGSDVGAGPHIGGSGEDAGGARR